MVPWPWIIIAAVAGIGVLAFLLAVAGEVRHVERTIELELARRAAEAEKKSAESAENGEAVEAAAAN